MHVHVHTEYSLLDGANDPDRLVRAAALDGANAICATDHGNVEATWDMIKAAEAHNARVRAGEAGEGIREITVGAGTEFYIAAPHVNGPRWNAGSILNAHQHDHDCAHGHTHTHAHTVGHPEEPDGTIGDAVGEAAKADSGDPDAVGGRKRHNHGTAIAIGAEGWRSLVGLSTESWVAGRFAGKPCVELDMLYRHRHGLIVSTGCLGGVLAQALLRGDEAAAHAYVDNLIQIMGRDNVIVELMDHGIPDERRIKRGIIETARKFGVRLVATNDAHFLCETDKVTHERMLAIQTKATMAERPVHDGGTRFAFQGEGYHLRTAAEMRHEFAEIPEACDNTLWIGERIVAGGPLLPWSTTMVDADPNLKPELPRQDLPTGEDDSSWLRYLAYEGARRRYGQDIPDNVRAQLDYELGVIHDLRFSRYFLVVAHLINGVRERGVRVGLGRGSAAGCLVAYCLNITGVDPIAYNLVFERFLNPGRASEPDIDIDFADREVAIAFLIEHYGPERVARIGTYSQILTRQALKDIARVLGHPAHIAEKIIKLLPDREFGRDIPLAVCLDPEKRPDTRELRELRENDPVAREIIDAALPLAGKKRGASIHASGVIVSDEPLAGRLPLRVAEGKVVAQADMNTAAWLGFTKIDALGLANLLIIDGALDLIELSTGTRPDIDTVPDELTQAFMAEHGRLLRIDETLTDPTDPRAAKAWQLIQRGDTARIFQIEGAAMRKLLRHVRPERRDGQPLLELAALVALYRPGPIALGTPQRFGDRKHGNEPVDYVQFTDRDDEAELLARALGDTYGLLVFQEQILTLANVVAGYDMVQADVLLAAVRKKKRAQMEKERPKWIEAITAQGYSQKLADTLWDAINAFADYGFAKAHAVPYAWIAYQTSWLAANYSGAYWAATLSMKPDKNDAPRDFAFPEMRAAGVNLLGPDVNLSGVSFVPDETGANVRFGLSSMRGISPEVGEAIVRERDENGPFVSLDDACRRIARAASTNALTVLAQVGALDNLPGADGNRGEVLGTLLARAVPMIDGTVPSGLFPDLSDDTKRRFERSILGTWVTSFPIDAAAARVIHREYPNAMGLKALVESDDSMWGDSRSPWSKVVKPVAFAIEAIEERRSRATGRTWARMMVAGLGGRFLIEASAMAKTWAAAARSGIRAGDVVIGQVTVEFENGVRRYSVLGMERVDVPVEERTVETPDVVVPEPARPVVGGQPELAFTFGDPPPAVPAPLAPAEGVDGRDVTLATIDEVAAEFLATSPTSLQDSPVQPVPSGPQRDAKIVSIVPTGTVGLAVVVDCDTDVTRTRWSGATKPAIAVALTDEQAASTLTELDTLRHGALPEVVFAPAGAAPKVAVLTQAGIGQDPAAQMVRMLTTSLERFDQLVIVTDNATALANTSVISQALASSPEIAARVLVAGKSEAVRLLEAAARKAPATAA